MQTTDQEWSGLKDAFGIKLIGLLRNFYWGLHKMCEFPLLNLFILANLSAIDKPDSPTTAEEKCVFDLIRFKPVN